MKVTHIYTPLFFFLTPKTLMCVSGTALHKVPIWTWFTPFSIVPLFWCWRRSKASFCPFVLVLK